MNPSPYIFDIRRGSTVDGPGIRTTVFFKGCNLNCVWCHNPEGKKRDRELAFFSEKCVGCGSCKEACLATDACRLCADCVRLCPTQARKLYGESYTEQELLDLVLPDLPFYNATGGGVTLSGGECMLYPAFLASFAALCREKGIHVAVDTAGNVPYASFEAVLPYVDLFLYDIKAMDPDLHKTGTGVDNRLILENLERLKQTGKEILIRVPVIPDFNDGEELEQITAYCEKQGLTYELLPYHSFGESKQQALEAAFLPHRQQ